MGKQLEQPQSKSPIRLVSIAKVLFRFLYVTVLWQFAAMKCRQFELFPEGLSHNRGMHHHHMIRTSYSMPPPSDHDALVLELLDDVFAVQQIPINESIPNHVLKRLGESGGQNFVSVTRTNEEISIVYNSTHAPIVDQSLAKWRCIKIRGPMDFGLTGILCAFTIPLKAAGIPIFALSTWNTDYILVPKEKADESKAALLHDGWKFR